VLPLPLLFTLPLVPVPLLLLVPLPLLLIPLLLLPVLPLLPLVPLLPIALLCLRFFDLPILLWAFGFWVSAWVPVALLWLLVLDDCACATGAPPIAASTETPSNAFTKWFIVDLLIGWIAVGPVSDARAKKRR
jgi:corin